MSSLAAVPLIAVIPHALSTNWKTEAVVILYMCWCGLYRLQSNVHGTCCLVYFEAAFILALHELVETKQNNIRMVQPLRQSIYCLFQPQPLACSHLADQTLQLSWSDFCCMF